MKIIGSAALALVAFAANSVLCRIALRQNLIDPASFTTIRLMSGAAILLLIGLPTQRHEWLRIGSWSSAVILALYALPFSFAYTQLSVGTGALVLSGCVQPTMLLAALMSGERPHAVQWMGLAVAAAGLAYLVFPGLSAPPLMDAAWMGIAGMSWGMYSLRGKGAGNPLGQTRGNFLRAVPFAMAVSLLAWPRMHMEREGVLLALASGIVASGLGYVAWYTALGGLTATRAASIQLSVPVLAAAGGVAFLAETITARLMVSTVLVLGGIALTIARRQGHSPPEGPAQGGPSVRVREGSQARAISAVVLVGVVFAGGAAIGQTQTPLLGVWKLNVAQSTYDPGPPPYKRVTCTIEPQDDGLKVTYDMVGMRGGVIHLEWSGRFDGQDYPVQGVDDVLSNAYRRIDDRTYEVVVKVDGRRAATARMVISPDGQHITTVSTQPGAQGQDVTTTTVYDRGK